MIEFDLDRLRDDSDFLYQEYGNIDERQLSLTKHWTETCDQGPLGLSVGSLLHGKDRQYHELEFGFNPLFDGMYVQEVYHAVEREFPDYAVGRVRFLRLFRGQCYSLHTDPQGPRVHIAITTAPECFIMTEGSQPSQPWVIRHIPADGHPYLIDTTVRHTAINASKSTIRTHMVFSMVDNGTD